MATSALCVKIMILSISQKGSTMPKELTHLIIAEASKIKFSPQNRNSMLCEQFERYGDYFRFGAVMHDISFCASSTANGIILKQKGREVHGDPPNDTLRPFKYLARVYDQTGKPEILSLIAGAVTHMMADCVFHPFVYYYSGNEISRHYRLETLIDTHLSEGQGAWLDKPVSTRDIYKNLKREFDFLATQLSGFLGLLETFKPEITKALALHAFTLKLFRSRMGYYLFRLIACLGSEDFKSKANLFYPSGMRFKAPFFDRNFTYRHPITGEVRHGSLDSFVESAVQKSCEMFEAIQTAAEKRSVESYFSTMPAVSFETGLDPSLGRSFKYTDVSVSIDRLISGQSSQANTL